ncbi:MAG: substrate-binding domain-containing protein [Bacteroidota bacterium]
MNRIRVALLVDKAESYDRELIRGILRYSNLSTPWEFFFLGPDYTVVREKEKIVLKTVKWSPDCIVMNDRFSIQDFEELTVPILVTPSIRRINGAINILADDSELGSMAAKYFIDKGFSNLAFYGSDRIFWSYDRKVAYRRTVLTAGLKFYSVESSLYDDWQYNPQQLVPWLKDLPKPVAVFACSDEFGTHLIEAVQMARLKVPDEVSILGVDNDEFVCGLYGIPMSSIDQNPEAVGFRIAQHIRSFIVDGKTLPSEIVGSDFRIITRLSTDVFAIDDPQLKTALSFIRQHSETRRITVDDVVKETHLSRRLLEIRFRKVLNRSILEEVKRVRIGIICMRLTETDDPVGEIASQMDFSSQAGFSNFFKKEMNISPVEYRKQFRKSGR